ncbi:MAG: hypothetical protein JW955_07250 [Sedimentisphaerales bacterium]|nr:hypothetical protein [Sedimentisphaerales bacterium]
MKKRKMLTTVAVALGGAVVGSFATLLGIRFWLGAFYTGEMTLVGQSPYHVSVPARPDARGRLYMLSYDEKYLLVLTSKSSEHPEPYYLDPGSRKIGLPSFGPYRRIPFLGCALVNAHVYYGFPLEGALIADWNVASDRREVHIRITGFKQEELWDSDTTMKEHMPIAYGNEIVLTRTWE